MEKEGNLFLKTDTTLSISEDRKQIEKNTEVLAVKRNKNSEEFYDYKHQVTNFIREEVVLQHRPPKGSISELIFQNDLENLEKELSKGNIDLNQSDCCGSTYSWTPLYWGVKLRRIECVQLLLSYDVDINIVVNDCDECCGTVLDLATLRDDVEMEELLRTYAEKEDVNLGQSFKAIRTKLRGKAPAFNFRYYGKQKKDSEVA